MFHTSAYFQVNVSIILILFSTLYQENDILIQLQSAYNMRKNAKIEMQKMFAVMKQVLTLPSISYNTNTNV